MSERRHGDAGDAGGERAAGEEPRVQAGGDVVVLAGGTGGAKLARGMLEVVGAERLVVIANTGDDIDIYGAAVSPDPDLVSFSLAGLIDERGWGIAGDTFAVMDGLRALGRDVWFNLGDRDLAWCLERARLISEGLRPTQALQRLGEAIGVTARVLPMADVPLRTFVDGMPFQEFMILRGGEGPVAEVRFEGRAPAEPSPEIREALSRASCVIVGPSNPVISIWPILNALGESLTHVSAPVVCVSPVVGGEIVKGPTAAFLDAYGHSLDAGGVLDFYESIAPGLIDGVVTDEAVDGGRAADRTIDEGRAADRTIDEGRAADEAVDEGRGTDQAIDEGRGTDQAIDEGQRPRLPPSLRIDTLMADAASRERVASAVLRFAEELAS